MQKGYKVLLIILGIIVILVIFVLIFINVHKSFGVSSLKADYEDYAKRSKIFKDGKFINTGLFTVMGEWNDPYKERTTKKGIKPLEELPIKNYEYKEASAEEVFITWFGHSSILIQMHGLNILVDPIFDNIASPVSLVGSKRYSKVPVKIEDLPKIDVVILSHNHYDHVAYNTIMSLENKVTKFIVPLGVDKALEKFGISKSKIENMAWWEEKNIDGLTIACTPARHFSGRYLLDQNETLWASWILKDEKNTIFDSGDTGYGDQFKEIYEKYGEIDFAFLDGSQYNERWHDVHMFPEEAVQATMDLNSKVSMVGHYGAFVLASHAWDDPVDRFTRFAKENNVNYITPILGETVNLNNYTDYQEEWWKEIK